MCVAIASIFLNGQGRYLPLRSFIKIATARLGSFEKDLGLVGTQYNTIISVFFVGYILTQVPTNMILNKMRPSIFLPVVMCCWAVVSASTGAVQNFTGAVILRFLLGFVEAPFFRKSYSPVDDRHIFILTDDQLEHFISSVHGILRKNWLCVSQFYTPRARWLVHLEDYWAVLSWAAWTASMAYETGDGSVSFTIRAILLQKGQC